MIQLLPKNMEGGIIYELGSGWGGLALLLAKHYPRANVIAFELSPIPYLVSRIRQFLSNRTNLTIVRGNFYDHNLSNARAVICYLFPDGMKKLAPKLNKELPEKCTIISNTYSLRELNNETIFVLDDCSDTGI